VGINSVSVKNDFIISPNPGNGIFSINASVLDAPFSYFKIFDVNGRMIKQIFPDEKKSLLDLSKNTLGIYFYKIKTNGGAFGGKIIVE
jgi:uncharacterized protein YxjI